MSTNDHVTTIRRLTAGLRETVPDTPDGQPWRDALDLIDQSAAALALDLEAARAHCERLHRAYLRAQGVNPEDMPEQEATR